jgi:hypothetical protein
VAIEGVTREPAHAPEGGEPGGHVMISYQWVRYAAAS